MLIPNWNQAHRFLSVQWATIVAAAGIIYTSSDQVKAYVPEKWVGPILTTAGVISFIARIYKQSNLSTPAAGPDTPCTTHEDVPK